MRNNNGAIVRRITRRTLGANIRRNFFITAAIVLTTFMMTSVFSVGISWLETVNLHPFRLEGTLTHMGFDATPERMDIVAGLDYVENYSMNLPVGYADLPGLSSQVNMRYIDENTWDNFSKPTFSNVVGRFALGGNEIMMSRHKLTEMGIENPHIGMEIPMEFTVIGSEDVLAETFILTAIYTEFVSTRGNAFTPIFVSHDFAVRHGRYHLEDMSVQVIFQRQSRAMQYAERLSQDLGLGDNWMLYMHPAILHGAGVNAQATFMVMGTIISFLMLTGFLLIYNVMYVSVSKDVRFYGILKTLGTTPRQLQRIVNGQVLRLSLIGLPIGMVLTATTSFVLIPAFMSTADAVISFSPLIYMGGAVFALLTAYLGAFTSAKKAAKVSPIEAIRYAGEQSANIKVRGSARGKPVKMALRNVFRERKRALVVLVSLFLGVSVFTIIMTVVNSLDVDYAVNSMYDHDFTIAHSSFDGFDQAAVSQIAAIPGVVEVRPDYFTAGLTAYNENLSDYLDLIIATDRFDVVSREHIMANGFMFNFRGIDMNWLIEWNAQQDNPFDDSKIEAFRRGEIILLDEIPFRFAYRVTEYEARQLFPIGMPLDIELGLDERAKTSVLIGGFADFRPNTGHGFRIGWGGSLTAFISADYLVELLGDNLALTHINLNVAGGYDEYVYSALNAQFDSSYTIVSRHEARQSMAAERQTMFVLGVGISAILGAIGIFNFINVISVGLLVRKREFAALESVGIAKRQMRAMLGWEGAIYWIITLAAALTVGNSIAIGLFALLRNSGEPQFATLSYPFIPVLAAYVIIVFVCSVTPKIAYKAMSKLSLVERLREVE